MAWFIWGRRGKSKHVTPFTIGWPGKGEWPEAGRSTSAWGEVVLAGSEGARTAEPGKLVAPLRELPVVANGLLGSGEWDLAHASLTQTPAGPLFVAASWNGELLSIMAALPAVSQLIGRTEVIMTLAPKPASSALPAHARAGRLGWDGRLHVSVLHVGESHGRSWRWREVDPEQTPFDEVGLVGAMTEKGDGSLPFVVAEWTVSLSSLGLKPSAGLKLPLAVFFVNLPPAQETSDSVRWPWGHSRAQNYNLSFLSEHPDGWGTVAIGSKTVTAEELGAPHLEQAPTLDGVLEEKEWQPAPAARETFLHQGHTLVRVGTYGGRLFVGIECQTLRLGVRPRAVEVYVDPAGDGGLLPRSDDRLVRITAETMRAVIYHWQPPASAKEDQVVTPEGMWVDPRPSRGEGMLRKKKGLVTAEVAVPLVELGLTADKLPERIGLLVKLIYDASFKIGEKSSK
ncbi:MAG: hypothetical protein J7M26_04735 [Armatimonadetes bacterium]|nr:hypothetical protein [Armatimonadota bacterium]